MPLNPVFWMQRKKKLQQNWSKTEEPQQTDAE